MLQGLVAGELWSSVQVPALASYKLLLVHPEGPQGEQREIVAVDLVGAGVGDRVLVALGRAARNAIDCPTAPIEAAIIAVVDGIERASPIPDRACNQTHEDTHRPRPKRPVRKKKEKPLVAHPQDETLDLFANMEEPENESETSSSGHEVGGDKETNNMPSIDDVDSIWNEAEEDEKGDS